MPIGRLLGRLLRCGKLAFEGRNFLELLLNFARGLASHVLELAVDGRVDGLIGLIREGHHGFAEHFGHLLIGGCHDVVGLLT